MGKWFGLAALFVVHASSALALDACHEEILHLRGDWGNAQIAVSVADTAESRSKGLMFVEDLPTMSGMLFVYDRAQSVIDESPLASLSLRVSASDPHRAEDGWQIETEAGLLRANHVVDTRTPRRIPTYGQFFLGREIRTERAVFDPARVQLMQFRPARSQGVDFVYILPFAPDRALVEVTSFAPASPGHARPHPDRTACGWPGSRRSARTSAATFAAATATRSTAAYVSVTPWTRARVP